MNKTTTKQKNGRRRFTARACKYLKFSSFEEEEFALPSSATSLQKSNLPHHSKNLFKDTEEKKK